ncbi:probable tRNA (uracil-O(2)-)-methyltransferase [Hylaeus anthracinus]|uniref:probable tRNA (uracil-O(2)-)-methyltransferase n=1 Tax=Hylaeus anthracinus TaxID=313031 RepID=UPI0023B8E888|nr:probable tRNA (uracil-O(2)-)-methyltransferase [Hylaeus anthracinus]XP_053998894.1 probable tRNA (uracil-O(2)-)-methyltransferase [Hylaeus anthracinus]
MEFKTLIRGETGASSSQFWKAIDIWCRNPQVVNRRLLACVEILNIEIGYDIFEIFQRINALDCSFLTANHNVDDICKKMLLDMLHISEEESVTQGNKTVLYVTKQLPRIPHLFSPGIEFSLLEKQENRVINIHKTFFAEKRSLGPRKGYMIHQEKDGCTSVSVYQSKNAEHDPSMEWLEKKLFPCMLKWMKSETKSNSVRLPSLSLVSTEKYATLYCDLKEKYSAKLIKNWPENTDPMKFVYEDIAIAAYLLLLWEKERSEKGTKNLQSFLDLGCGNGLLVYILCNEGHRGLGIDLRRRKIWDLYPPEIPLEVSTIIPSSTTVYPGVDWIIGNHSDELTPWIPVIAARSSADCRFFLLPCCPYELDGTKYQRHSASKSQYSEYIDYVRSVCEECGFVTHTDKLRIPSTKRICLIGWRRIPEDVETRENRIQEMISAKTTFVRQKNETNETRETDGWTCDFKPRATVEKVRNCTQLDKTLIADIVNMVANQLLEEGRAISVEETPRRTWNAGRCLELRQIAESIPREIMIRLRKECGGLQTLLKNHRHVFRVAQGKVEFRIPGGEGIVEKSRKKDFLPRTKVKPCWFHENHPNGCPTTETKCNFKH